MKSDASAARVLKTAGKLPKPRSVPFPSRRAGVTHYESSWNAEKAFSEAQASFNNLGTVLWYGTPKIAPQEDGGSSDFAYKWDPLTSMLDQAQAAGVVPQIGFEVNNDSNIGAFARDLGTPSSGTYKQVVQWARALKDRGPVFLRPLSEMNDEGNTWSLVKYPDTSRFAATWKALHDIFDREGATNCLWLFDVMETGSGLTRAGEVMSVLEKIPAGYIDGLGIHPYTRLYNDVSFEAMTRSWLREFDGSRHSSCPRVIGEMGISDSDHIRHDAAEAQRIFGDPNARSLANNAMRELKPAWDETRARWVREAFAYAKSHFRMVTYFNELDSTWAIRSGHARYANSPKAWAELQKQIGEF